MSFLQIAPPDKSVKINLSSTPSNGEVLVYNGTSGEWEPGSAAGGSDPWTTIKLASNFSVNTKAQAAITGWSFVPLANKTYEFEVRALAICSSASTGVRPGYLAMGGTIACGAEVVTPSTVSASALRNLFGATEQRSGSTAAPTTLPHLVQVNGLLISGASPSGTLQMALASEVAASYVTYAAGSFFRYREV